MNILVITGSARKNGNSEALADAFIRGAGVSGNKVVKLSVHNKKIAPCLDCRYCCRNEGRCVQRDDMEGVFAALAEADMAVIASPVYFYGFPAQLKCLFDRLYSPLREKLHIGSAVLLAVCADSGSETFGPMIAMYKAVLNYFGIEDKGIVTADRVTDRGDIAGNPKLEEAYLLGRSLQ